MIEEYAGSCHCGAVRFAFRGEPITGGVRCNCSICRRRNAVMSHVYYKPDAFEITAGADELTIYRWGDEMVDSCFCRRCGVYTFHTATDNPDHGYRVNLGCVDGVDILELPLRVFDGADTWTYLD